MKEKMPLKCRKCGKRVAIITWGIYRKAVVDPEAVMVHADPEGVEFVRADGSKVRGEIVADIGSELQAEPAYRKHRCGGKR